MKAVAAAAFGGGLSPNFRGEIAARRRRDSRDGRAVVARRNGRMAARRGRKSATSRNIRVARWSSGETAARRDSRAAIRGAIAAPGSGRDGRAAAAARRDGRWARRRPALGGCAARRPQRPRHSGRSSPGKPRQFFSLVADLRAAAPMAMAAARDAIEAPMAIVADVIEAPARRRRAAAAAALCAVAVKESDTRCRTAARRAAAQSKGAAHGETCTAALGDSSRRDSRAAQADGCACGGCAARRPHGEMAARSGRGSIRGRSHAEFRDRGDCGGPPLKAPRRLFGRFGFVLSASDRAAAERVKEFNPPIKFEIMDA
jgi:hypothetical protein